MTQERATGCEELFEAVHGGDDDAVVRLLRSGVPAGTTDGESGETALYRASVSNEPGIVRLLLAAGADPDGASGRDGVDLPLCGAASGGHTEVVRALLAAGAEPDRREEFDFTALSWAVRAGYARTAEALLEAGADPGAPGPGGVLPLVAAVTRGSAETVRVLLRHGADAGSQRAALDEARRWLALDTEQEARRQLEESYGGAFGSVARRVVEEGGVTVLVELVGAGAPWAGAEQQSGHAAIATLLEAELGIRAPFEELADRALRCGDPADDDWAEAMHALQLRGDEETFQAAVARAASADPLQRAFAADVLGQLGFATQDRPFVARSLPLLLDLADRTAQAADSAGDDVLIASVVQALGHHGDRAALPAILRHAGHPDPEVRLRVALALHGLVEAADSAAVDALIVLSEDSHPRVRDWATLGLATVDADTPRLREALAARLDDADPDTAAEAARGLVMRGDPRATDTLIRILADEDPDGYAHGTALEAVGDVADPAVRSRLERTLPRCR
ncbi:ankyrin repeat domain-containing protein [Streptomyces sp. NBC_01766]|uniref:ankyrin repeat domain-containing protein n=1 Tax=Streptomyces sp. NBC_01766 TaxID=2975936 RepID=UPI002DDC80F8|nr:ankyrin repeat domain-containing protein [Streptomyces sp. NBC_01766]WSC23088.1 HEAT repeat domain-containing protein [Streptomyces sp. NBC_01766]